MKNLTFLAVEFVVSKRDRVQYSTRMLFIAKWDWLSSFPMSCSHLVDFITVTWNNSDLLSRWLLYRNRWVYWGDNWLVCLFQVSPSGETLILTVKMRLVPMSELRTGKKLYATNKYAVQLRSVLRWFQCLSPRSMLEQSSRIATDSGRSMIIDPNLPGQRELRIYKFVGSLISIPIWSDECKFTCRAQIDNKCCA